ncbi:glycosyltransferase family 4 protein [Paraburkholderia phenoliruptrix]|nr:glycosyltransferase family 4 protein [Paraburkholderia phenoliruptrix]
MLTNLALRLKDDPEFKPIVLIPDPKAGEMVSLLDQHGIDWREVPSMKWYIFQTQKTLPGYVCDLLGRARQYAEALWSADADIAIVNTLTNLEGVLGCYNANIPYVLWAHGIIDSTQAEDDPATRNVLDKIVMELASGIVTCSDWTSEFFKQVVPHKSIRTIHNWTNIESKSANDPGPRTFCALSTLQPHKGIDILIQAVALLKNRGFPVHVNLYGAGDSANSLKALACDLGVDDLVHFRGRVTDVAGVYQRSIATLMPSFVEPFGMVAIESMALGTPVIAASTGGLKDIIEHQVSGHLFRPGDIDDLASSIYLLATNAEYRDTLSVGGKNRVRQHFDGTQSLAKFANVFEEVTQTFTTYDRHARDRVEILQLATSGSTASADANGARNGHGEAFPQLSLLGTHDANSVMPHKIGFGADISQDPFRWFYLEATDPMTWSGIDIVLLLADKSSGVLITEIVQNGQIVVHVGTEMSRLTSQATSRITWPPLKLDKRDSIELRFAVRNSSGAVCLLEWEHTGIRYPLCSLLVQDREAGSHLRWLGA